VRSAETTYAILISLALLVNGLAVAGATPLRTLVAPLRDHRLLVRAAAIDVLVVPLVLLGPAVLLDLPTGVIAGVAIVAAASNGPIGVALTRMGRGDVPVAVALVTALGAANVVTIPVLMMILVPAAVGVPVVAIAQSLLLLLGLPLAAGALLRRAQVARRRHPEAIALTARRLGTVASVLLTVALASALAIDPRGIVAAATGPLPVIALVALALLAAAARLVTRDPVLWRTLWLTLSARSVGVALAVVALHLPSVPGTLSAVLVVGGLTQIVPVLLLLVTDRVRRLRARRRTGATRP
jgi:BASS family bile acid:Na+ symporter